MRINNNISVFAKPNIAQKIHKNNTLNTNKYANINFTVPFMCNK